MMGYGADEEDVHKFEHKGIKIFITDAGQFYADTKDGRVRASSLGSLKKKLDKKSGFKPFKGFVIEGYHDETIRDVEVVAIEKRRNYRELKFRTATGSTLSEVCEDTPANRKLANQYIKAASAFKRVEKAHEDSQKALERKITKRTPEVTEL